MNKDWKDKYIEEIVDNLDEVLDDFYQLSDKKWFNKYGAQGHRDVFRSIITSAISEGIESSAVKKIVEYQVCPKCNGSRQQPGHLFNDECSLCEGEGKIIIKEEVIN